MDHAEYRRPFKRIDGLHNLRNGGDEAKIDPAGSQHFRCMLHNLPGFRKVEHQAVERHTIIEEINSFIDISPKRYEIRNRPHISLDVGHGCSGKILTGFVRDNQSSWTRRAKERHREGAGAGPCFKYTSTGIDIGPHRNQREVFRIEHLSTAWHLENVVSECGAESKHLFPARQRHQRAIRLSDKVVVSDLVPAE